VTSRSVHHPSWKRGTTAQLKRTEPQAAPRLASLAEAAEHLGCSVRTIRRRISAGEITGYRFGPRLLRVDLEELECSLRPIPTAGAGRTR